MGRRRLSSILAQWSRNYTRAAIPRSNFRRNLFVRSILNASNYDSPQEKVLHALDFPLSAHW
jgi:hypothetical protein